MKASAGNFCHLVTFAIMNAAGNRMSVEPMGIKTADHNPLRLHHGAYEAQVVGRSLKTYDTSNLQPLGY
jgi:hypothetical protein